MNHSSKFKGILWKSSRSKGFTTAEWSQLGVRNGMFHFTPNPGTLTVNKLWWTLLKNLLRLEYKQMLFHYKPTSLLSTSLGFCILRVVLLLWGPLDQNFNNISLIMPSLPTYKKVQTTSGEIHLNYFCTCTKKKLIENSLNAACLISSKPI